jgi:hypothetical protein
MKNLITLYFLDDRTILILFKLIKFGIIKTKSSGFSGYSIVFGIWRIEIQFNLSYVENNKIILNKSQYGKA